MSSVHLVQKLNSRELHSRINYTKLKGNEQLSQLNYNKDNSKYDYEIINKEYIQNYRNNKLNSKFKASVLNQDVDEPMVSTKVRLQIKNNSNALSKMKKQLNKDIDSNSSDNYLDTKRSNFNKATEGLQPPMTVMNPDMCNELYIKYLMFKKQNQQ